MTSSIDSFLFEQIAEAIRMQIARGELQSGDRLPSIRETAAAWNCTPGTVNRAYAILAGEGLVTGHRGSGTRVMESPLPPEQTRMLPPPELCLREHAAPRASGSRGPQQTFLPYMTPDE